MRKAQSMTSTVRRALERNAESIRVEMWTREAWIQDSVDRFEAFLRERFNVPKKKTPKPTVKKAHKIARRIAKSGGVRNPWAVGMATAKKSARKRKAKRGIGK
jgi:hypothetical protein